MIIRKKNPQPGVLVNAPPKAQAANDSLESIDLPDTGPSHPNWLFPKTIEGLLVLGDERERELVERLLHVGYRALGSLDLAVSYKQSALAKSHLEDALMQVKAFAKSANNLNALRSKGLQHVTKITLTGPTLGLGAKIQRSLNPAEGTPEARLIEEVCDVASAFENASERFLREARLVEHAKYTKGDYDYARWRGSYLQTLEDAKEFRTLAARALTAAIDLDAAVINLSRGRRQTMVIEDRTASVFPTSEEKPEPTAKRHEAA